MKGQQLVEEVLATSQLVNPTYTHNEHLAWALGILAQVVLEKNFMDSIVFSRLNHRLNTLVKHNKYK
jgi:hypothetical protein